MNTSRKGSSYENAYRRVLEARGYWVTRSAASLGPWDLVAMQGAPYSELILIQCKNDGRSCRSAQNAAVTLRNHASVPGFARVILVHPGKTRYRWAKQTGERFCEH